MASEAGPVSIVVEIIDQFSDELNELRTEIEAIDKQEIDISVDIDVEEEVKKVQAQLKELEKRLDTTLDIDTSGFEKAMAEKAMLEADTSSTHTFNTERGSKPPPIDLEGMEAVKDVSRQSVRRAAPDIGGDKFKLSDPDVDPFTYDDLIDIDSAQGDFLRDMQLHSRRARDATGHPLDEVPHIPTSTREWFEGGGGDDIGAPSFGRGKFAAQVDLDPKDWDFDPLQTPRQLIRGTGVADMDLSDFDEEVIGAAKEASRDSIRRAAPRDIGGDRFRINRPDVDAFSLEGLSSKNLRQMDFDPFEDFDPLESPRQLRRGQGMTSLGVPIDVIRGDADRATTGPRGLGRGPPFGRQARKRLRKLGATLDKLRPNIMMVWNALAAMIPVFISLGAAAIGLAGGLIAVGTAGAAVLGLGLLGWGEDFGSSMENLTQQARQLGSQLFDVMQPVSRTAQPILQDWMEGAPRQVQQLVDPLRNLINAYEDTLGQIGAGIVDWVVRVINRMTAMEDMISQMTLRFGGIAGDFLIEFMTNMVKFAYENQDALIRMAAALRDVFSIILKLAMFVTRLLSVLQPLIPVLDWIAGILFNKFTAGITAAILAIMLMNAALATMTSMSAAAGAGLLAAISNAVMPYITMVYQAVAATWAWIASLSALRAALALTGIGLVAVGAGAMAMGAMDDMGGGGPSRGGGGSSFRSSGGTSITINGDVEKKQMDRLLDEVPGESRNEMTMNEEMER